jgi:hypothetical protein
MTDVQRKHLRRVLLAEKFLLITGTLLLGFAVLLIYASSTARAHSWYEPECCDLRDCEPIPPDQVKVTPDGYITPDGELIKFNEARVSADKDFHWCKYQKNSTQVIQPLEKRKCFYAPAGGV